MSNEGKNSKTESKWSFLNRIKSITSRFRVNDNTNKEEILGTKEEKQPELETTVTTLNTIDHRKDIVDIGHCRYQLEPKKVTLPVKKKPLTPPVPPRKLNEFNYYVICSGAGLIASGISNTVVTPLDLVKTHLQIYPNVYKNLVVAFEEIKFDYGAHGKFRGWVPISIGHTLHGLCQFGLYEYYRNKYTKLYQPKDVKNHKMVIAMYAATTSEFFSTLLLCPFEAIKVKIQTNSTNNFHEALHNILAIEGVNGLYKGLVPMWCRQIPYTIVKFTLFEEISDYIYKKWLYKPQHKCSVWSQIVISFGVGYLTGIVGAIVSHPADTYITRLYFTNYGVNSQRVVVNGSKGQISCLIVRILMIGTLSGLQWFIYNSLKIATKTNNFKSM